MYLPKIVIITATALTTLAGPSFALEYDGPFAETFDEIGTTGTTLPTGFTYYVGEAGTSNTTWSTAITANGASGSVASMVPNTNGLAVTTTPSGTNNNGFNAAASSSNTSDRVVATSPTGISGVAFNLELTNTTDQTINSLNLGYTIQRFTSVTTANELPGYQIFVSLGGNSWTNIAAFNPTTTGANGTIAVPNTVGTTIVPSTLFTLPAGWAVGSNLEIRWVDDNAVQTSPDQIIGLNNVAVTSAVPEPSTLGAILVGMGTLALSFRRKRS